MKKEKPSFKFLEVVIIVFISTIIMGVATIYVSQFKNPTIKINATEDENINDFIEVYNSILADYFGEVKEDELIEAAIRAMVGKLDDPYTSYLNEQSKDVLLEGLKGTYEGIGIEITANEKNEIIITSVFEKTPASKAGLLKDDIILSINDESLKDKTVIDATTIIKKTKDKKVTIEVLRNDEVLSFNLERKILYVPEVFSEMFEKNNKKIVYIRIEKFSLTASHQFKVKLKELEDNNIDNLIIDVRSNTGGYLMSAKDIISMFLKEKEIMYITKSKSGKTEFKDETKEHRTYKVAVLTNENSASASEVLAGALKYSYDGIIIGKKTFGKGKVQQTTDAKDGAMIKYTTAEWLLPNGDAVDGKGIKPDIDVALSNEYYDDPSIETDNQLQTAINELSK